MSDTHGMHSRLAVPDGDVLIHCGDFSGMGTERDLIALNQWLGTLPHKTKLVSPGNHDIVCEDNPSYSELLLSNATLCIDRSVEIQGIKFFLSPWTPEFGRWSFMLPRGEGLRSVWSFIPDDTDVLITHGPPYGILDLAPGLNGQPALNAGCRDLLARVLEVRPRLHVFGHIHEGSGVALMGDTTFINAAICDESYSPTNPVRIYDL